MRSEPRKPGTGFLRVALVLARVSNLPTVWSDCLAAWILAGGREWARLILVCAGGSLLYTGGMFLNDAFDVNFDRRYRPERPIVSGQVSARAVWLAGTAFLVFGWSMMASLGRPTAALAFGLAALIVIYDAIHKRTPFAPFLMAGCRFGLYLVAGAAASVDWSEAILWRGAALGGYILGVSYLARGESTGAAAKLWPLPLLWCPIVVALVAPAGGRGLVWAACAVVAVWLCWCAFSAPKSVKFLSRGIAGLLAGIVWVDWLAATSQPHPLTPIFLAFFFAALLLQRVAPAT